MIDERTCKIIPGARVNEIGASTVVALALEQLLVSQVRPISLIGTQVMGIIMNALVLAAFPGPSMS
jgi:hypothetical protein